MDTIFIEEFSDDKYKLAVIDRELIFSSNDPGALSNIIECSISNPTREDDAQVFYSLVPIIKGSDFFTDFRERRKSHRLNHWSIGINKDSDNIFERFKPCTKEEYVTIYSKRGSITPEFKDCKAKSIADLFSHTREEQLWKNNVLQECLDRLLKHEFRKNPQIYELVDSNYFLLMRFKLETESDKMVSENSTLHACVLFMKRICNTLGIEHTHDTKSFTEIPKSINHLIDFIAQHIPIDTSLPLQNKLSMLFTLWSGSKIEPTQDGYNVIVNKDVIKALSYMQKFLTRPTSLILFD